MQRKKRILMVGEASYTLSGFGTYNREVIGRLHKTGKYEIAELSSFGVIQNPLTRTIPWKFYANALHNGDPRQKIYDSHPSFAFGKWRFEKTLLHFKPDIVWDIRDYWMLAYEADSPFRRFYHWVIMPTVDSAPQQEEWIETFLRADGVLTYTDWAQDVLKKEGGGKIKLCGTAIPGVTLDIFKPIKDNSKVKQKMGLPPDINLIGTVMRNQKRKLFPDLFRAFSLFLDLCKKNGRPELAKKTFLYCHTSFPDFGWNIPLLLKEHNIAHKVIFTYKCRNCQRCFAAIFQDAKTKCPHCHETSAVTPSVASGLSYEEMAGMMQMFDIYVQYASCEGTGLPQAEAAACGVPIMSINYSGMEDLIKKTKGTPLEPKGMFLDLDIGAYRAYPNNEDTANQFYKFLTLPEGIKQRKCQQARKGAEKYFNWDDIAEKWENYFDNVELTDQQGNWDSEPKLLNPHHRLPTEQEMGNVQFVEWLISTVLQQPERRHSFWAMRLLRELNFGTEIQGRQPAPVNRQIIYDRIMRKVTEHNQCEQIRCGMLPFVTEDYLEYADHLQNSQQNSPGKQV